MNILQSLRKPYLSIFLSTLILFVSCSPTNLTEESDTQIQMLTLEEYAVIHKDLASEMSALLQFENMNDLEKLINYDTKNLENLDVTEFLQKEGIKVSDELIELSSKMFKNAQMLQNNPMYESYSKEKLLNEAIKEIEMQFDYQNALSQKGDECDDLWTELSNRCLENFATTVAVTTFIGAVTTFGAGSLIGYLAALVIHGECNKSAQEEVAECRGE